MLTKANKFLKKENLNLYIVIALLTSLQSISLNSVSLLTGLDGGMTWLMNFALVNGEKAFDFVSPYGPLAPLDHSDPTWPKLFWIRIIFSALVNSILALVIFKLLSNHIPKRISFFFSLLITTICSQAVPNSYLVLLILVTLIFSNIFENISPSRIYFFIGPMAFLVSFLWHIRSFSGYVAFLLFAVGISRTKLTLTCRMKSLFYLFFSTCFFVYIIFIALGFSSREIVRWFEAFREITIGYSDMAIEVRQRIWEYPAFILCVVFFNKKIISKMQDFLPKFFFVALMLILFKYGFNRHDGHSVIIFLIFLFISFQFLSSGKEKITSLALLVVSLLCIGGGAIGAIKFTYFMPKFEQRLHNIRDLYGMTNEKIRLQINRRILYTAREHYGLPSYFLHHIHGEPVSVIPWFEPISYAYNQKVNHPPVASLFSAYTKRLDEMNLNWLKSSRSTKFIYSLGAASIDERYPLWDSPKFQLGLVCEYKVIEEYLDSLLYEKRNRSVCAHKKSTIDPKNVSENLFLKNQKGIVLLNLHPENSFFKSLFSRIFKDFWPMYVEIDGKRYRVPKGTSTGLLIYVPNVLDAPNLFKISDLRSIKFPDGTYDFSLVQTRL